MKYSYQQKKKENLKEFYIKHYGILILYLIGAGGLIWLTWF